MRKKNATETAVFGLEIIAIIKTEALLPTVLTITLLIHPAHIVPILTALTVMPALAQAIWQIYSAPAVITCTMIPLAGLFIATAK